MLPNFFIMFWKSQVRWDVWTSLICSYYPEGNIASSICSGARPGQQPPILAGLPGKSAVAPSETILPHGKGRPWQFNGTTMNTKNIQKQEGSSRCSRTTIVIKNSLLVRSCPHLQMLGLAICWGHLKNCNGMSLVSVPSWCPWVIS